MSCRSDRVYAELGRLLLTDVAHEFGSTRASVVIHGISRSRINLRQAAPTLPLSDTSFFQGTASARMCVRVHMRVRACARVCMRVQHVHMRVRACARVCI